MNPRDHKMVKNMKGDLMDMGKRPRKMDKLDKISGLGAANRSFY
jgi:hypothetical protein